jgi:hypothetical protein
VSEKGWLNAPTIPEMKDWRPLRVVLYWVLAELTYLTLFFTLKVEGLKSLFWYFAPKP